MKWSNLRTEFPILDQETHGHPLIYFDNAASSQKPKAVVDALTHYYTRDHANVHRGLHELSMRATLAFEEAREKVRGFLGAAHAAEIIFTRGTTEAINLVAQVWAAQFLKSGDVILSTAMEHHSNLVPWQMAAQRSGALLRHVPVLDDGTLDLAALDALLTEQVKIFSFVHISNSLGTLNPVRELCAKARAVGAVTLVDGAQAAGHVPVNVVEIGCDFYTISGHKMCGPTGIGALYGRLPLLEQMQPWHGGGEMILSVGLDSSTYKAPPAKFEAGTPPIADAIALGAAVDYLEGIGLEGIEAYDAELTKYAMRRLRELPGLKIFGPAEGPRGALVAFTLECAHPHDLVEFANSHGLALRGGHHCTQPLMKRFRVPGTTRASFYFYNTHAEIDRMIDILREAVTFFN
jgi:cysteine desulfurase/selenocysteine lyase